MENRKAIDISISKILFTSICLMLMMALFSTVKVTAQPLELSSLFQSDMVLQQNSDALVWGWGTPGHTVTIHNSWQDTSYKGVIDEDGRWEINIATPEAGGPYLLTVQSDSTITLNNILIGEVWIASGQSNMEMPVKGRYGQGVSNSLRTIVNASNDRIRLFTAGHHASRSLQNNVEGTWSVARPQSVGDFSAVGYAFARQLSDVLDVPVGIIHSSWGGTPVRAWTDQETLESYGVKENPDDRMRSKPATLFNSMIYPLIPFAMRGVIWYQGENDHSEPQLYKKVFPAMIRSWRDKWEEGNFPFYFVQIAPYEYKDDANSAYLREAQLWTMKHVDNTGMAVTLDIGMEQLIHPREKFKIGDRLAFWALAKTYGVKGIDYSGPIYDSMEVKDGKAYITFDHAEMGLAVSGDSLSNFEIAGADSVFYPAKAEIIRREGIAVWSKDVPEPVAVRYAWKDWVVGDLFDTYGLPASSFRTDDW